MRIAMVGTGYVGLVTGTCLAEMGNEVICVDVDAAKIERLRQGEIPIYEPGLAELVKGNMSKGSLVFTTQLKDALAVSDVCFIAVGTPMGEDGSADLQYVLAVARELGQYMVRDMIVVDKSTVPVGTAELVRQTIQQELAVRGVKLHFAMVSNPEFLKEGNACADFLKPDRVVLGTDDARALETMQELYAPFLRSTDNIITMDIPSAELTKYAANAMLATKISFMNEMANICEHVGADVNKVRRGIGSDSRIGFSFIYPGCGYGGSCFPKDVQALVRTSAQHGYESELLQAVEAVNGRQKRVLGKKVVSVFGEDLTGKVFAIWGLAFKPETDDMRAAPSVTLIEELTGRGAQVQAYDPKAEAMAQRCYLKGNERVRYVRSKYDALDGADALVLVTEWKEFRSPDFLEMANRLRGRVVFDGRNQYKARTLQQYGFRYYQIGVQAE